MADRYVFTHGIWQTIQSRLAEGFSITGKEKARVDIDDLLQSFQEKALQVKLDLFDFLIQQKKQEKSGGLWRCGQRE